MISATLGVVAIIVRFLLAAILFRAGLHKMRDLSSFQTQLKAYQLLPESLLPVTTVTLVVAETLSSIGLLNLEWKLPALVAAGLFSVYAAAMALNLSRGRTDIDCGCGGPLAARQRISRALVARNAGLVISSLFCFFTASKSALTPLDYLTLTFGVATSLLLYEAAEQTLANLQKIQDWRKPGIATFMSKP